MNHFIVCLRNSVRRVLPVVVSFFSDGGGGSFGWHWHPTPDDLLHGIPFDLSQAIASHHDDNSRVVSISALYQIIIFKLPLFCPLHVLLEDDVGCSLSLVYLMTLARVIVVCREIGYEWAEVTVVDRRRIIQIGETPMTFE